MEYGRCDLLRRSNHRERAGRWDGGFRYARFQEDLGGCSGARECAHRGAGSDRHFLKKRGAQRGLRVAKIMYHPISLTYQSFAQIPDVDRLSHDLHMNVPGRERVASGLLSMGLMAVVRGGLT